MDETSPSDVVAEMHRVMCESDWPVHSPKRCRVTRHDTGRVHWRVAGVLKQEVSDRNMR